MPSIPHKQPLVEFLADKGYWVFYPRWRGSWESAGRFLENSPVEDILDVVAELRNGVTEIAFGKQFSISPDEIFVIGGSFGGAAAVIASLDERVTKVVANCPVVDWAVLDSGTEKRNLKSELRRVHPRSFRRCVPPFGQELEQATTWLVLQSRSPPERDYARQNHDVPCQG